MNRIFDNNSKLLNELTAIKQDESSDLNMQVNGDGYVLNSVGEEVKVIWVGTNNEFVNLPQKDSRIMYIITEG